jgi:FtsP/CotA-like multicopper oxidase with cupredoxin domain
MLTGKQVYKGFAGFFIVTDPDENIFNLPSGNFDVPLCIQDRRIADIPQFTYSPTSYEMMWGYLGDTVLVNGTPNAYLSVSRTLYRFRLLNGSNARVYRIAFSDNRQFHIIATDGGLKDQPVAVNEFKLSPGERVDILFDFSPYTIGQNVKLVSLPYTHSGTLPYKQGIALDIIRFDIVNNISSGGVIPSAFNPITYYDINSVNNVRNFTLSLSGSGHPMHRINGLTFDINRIDWEVPLHSLEEWKIINTTADFHPMHSHEVQFQVYSRNGNTNLPPSDKGWKDTVLVNPGETVRTLVKFTGYKGIYLYHCHNLEHEDDGMMLNFRVIDPIGIRKTGTEIPEEFKLFQNYPNPFNSSTVLKFRLPRKDKVVLNIYDSKARLVVRLFEGELNAGEYEISWNAGDYSSGIYFARLNAGVKHGSVKMILAK